MLFSRNSSNLLNGLLILDITPYSIGIKTASGVMTVLIPKNSSIPIKKYQDFTAYSENSSRCCLRIFEGEKAVTKDCNLLGIFCFEGITPAPIGVPKLEVCFSVDADGMFEVLVAINYMTKKNTNI